MQFKRYIFCAGKMGISGCLQLNITACILLFASCVSLAQPSESTQIISLDTYLNQVRKFHPLAQKTALKIEIAELERLRAKGRLDPIVDFGWNQKNFDEKLYYRLFQGQIKLPTKYGLSAVGGYENSEGVFLNPENKTDQFGLWNLGIELDVLQGLIVNERNIGLQQAEVILGQTMFNQAWMLNTILYEAAAAYLQWQQFYLFNQVFLDNQSLSQTYLENTKQLFFNGEKSAIDTLEAFILLQDATNAVNENGINFTNAQIAAQNYFWEDGQRVIISPNELPQVESILPETNISQIDTTNIFADHPILQAYAMKQRSLELGQRLKREKRKPKLKVKYNPLLATSDEGIAPNYVLANYKWGFNFAMPLFMRTERADIQIGLIKLEELELDRNNKANELNNKLDGSLQQLVLLQDQLILAQQTLEGYQRLLDGENEKFRAGESSVFLLNKRQEKYITGQLKLITLQTKLQKEYIKYLYLTNQIDSLF